MLRLDPQRNLWVFFPSLSIYHVVETTLESTGIPLHSTFSIQQLFSTSTLVFVQYSQLLLSCKYRSWAHCEQVPLHLRLSTSSKHGKKVASIGNDRAVFPIAR